MSEAMKAEGGVDE